MSEMGIDEPPDPASATSPAALVALLRQLRLWAGEPSLRRLRRLGGTVDGATGTPIDRLPETTTSYVLRGDRPPSAEFVRAFVAACLIARQRRQAQIDAQVERWHTAWLRVRGHHSNQVVVPGAADSTDPATATQPCVPRQLPHDLAWFTGRERELATLRRWLLAPRPGAPPLVAIAGPGGAGKSALAIHAAHRLAAAYPDGQLYVDLHGNTAGLAALDPSEVLGRLLRALGAAGSEVPEPVDEAAAAFRSMTATRRLLLVLDNVAGPDQARPLLPGAAGCAVLMTSRRPLTPLVGPYQLHLAGLPAAEAIELLARLAGRERIDEDLPRAALVHRLCGGLPLALHIAGAKLAARPHWSVGDLAHRLAGQRRLGQVRLPGAEVRRSCHTAYQELRGSTDESERAAARAYQLLGVWNGPDLALPAASQLLGCRQETEAVDLLQKLVDVRLLGSHTRGRYHLHGLLRLHVRELSGQVPPQQAAAAVRRLLGFYTATAWHCCGQLRPGDRRVGRAAAEWSAGGLRPPGATAAAEWLATERPNLLAAAEQAAATPGVAAAAVQLAQALFAFFVPYGHWQDWVRLNQTAMEVAAVAGDHAALAQACSDLGVAQMLRGSFHEAVALLRRSLAVWCRLADPYGRATSLNNLGMVYWRLRRYAESLQLHRRSLAIYRELGDVRGQADSRNNLGTAYARMGSFTHAAGCFRDNITVRRALADEHGLAVALNNLGVVRCHQGFPAEAVTYLQQSLRIFRQLGSRSGCAAALRDLGRALAQQHRPSEALVYLRESLLYYQALGDPYRQAECLRQIARVLRRLGRGSEAQGCGLRAASIQRRLRATTPARAQRPQDQPDDPIRGDVAKLA